MCKKQQEIESSYYGVDLSAYECRKLVPDPIYSNYKKQELHFPIGAIQKGLKPHTKIGIKRIEKRNQLKKLKLQNAKRMNQDQNLKKLNPKSPEEICMKALRIQFRQKLEKNYIENQSENNKLQVKGRLNQNRLANSSTRRRQRRIISTRQKCVRTKQMSQVQIKRKENQKNRRRELNILVQKYKPNLVKIFGPERFRGYGRCQKISRQQIWKALNFTPEQANIFYERHVLKLQKKQEQKNQDANIDIKLLRLSAHNFTTTVQFYVNQQSQPLILPYPFPNNEIYLNLNSTDSNKVYQFYPNAEQKKFLTRYVSSESLSLTESNADIQQENPNISTNTQSQTINQNFSPKNQSLNFYINSTGCFPISWFPFKTQKFYIQRAKKQILLQVPSPSNEIYINIQKLASIKDNQPFNIYTIVAYDASSIPNQHRSEYVRYVFTTNIVLQEQSEKRQQISQSCIAGSNEENIIQNRVQLMQNEQKEQQ